MLSRSRRDFSNSSSKRVYSLSKPACSRAQPGAQWRERSVAEVLEAERQLSDELRATHKANASLLDKLDSLQAASKATDQEHTTFLHGKVRHLLKQHMGVGGEKPPETRWR